MVRVVDGSPSMGRTYGWTGNEDPSGRIADGKLLSTVRTYDPAHGASPPTAGTCSSMQRAAARRRSSRSTGCRSSRSSRRAPTSTSTSSMFVTRERVRGRGVLAGHGCIGRRGGVPGPGLTNVLTSMTNALLDRNAVLYVVGSTPSRRSRRTACRSGSTTSRSRRRSASGRARSTRSTSSSDRGASHPRRDHSAGRCCSTSRPMCSMRGRRSGAPVSAIAGAAPSAAAVDACLERLAAASRPVVLLGGSPDDGSSRVKSCST